MDTTGNLLLVTVGRSNRRTVRIKIPAPFAEGTESAPRRGARRRAAVVALHSQDAAGARVGIQPEHAAVGGQPFQTVVRFARRSRIRALHVRQIAWPFAPDSIENFTQGTHVARLHAFARPIGLSIGRRGRNGTHDEGK